MAGNLRVLRMYWKSKRAIQEVKSYDPETGEEVYNFYPEYYVLHISVSSVISIADHIRILNKNMHCYE